MCSVARAAADCAEQALNSARPFAVETMGSRILDGVYEERSHPYLTVEQRLRTSEEGGLYVESQVLRLRSEEHTSELQSLMRTSYAVFCLKKKNTYYPTIDKS